MSNVVKFPYDASRRVHPRKPRRSKNGTPEERAAKGAAQPKLSEDDWREFIGLVGQIEPQRLSRVLEYMRLLAAEAKLRS